jgi:hypothetical protein
MRLTLKEFKHAYRIYKNDFDLENLIRYNRTTYAKLEGRDKKDEGEEWQGVVIDDIEG